MAQRSPTCPVAMLNSCQRIVVPLARAMKDEMMDELDAPQLGVCDGVHGLHGPKW